MNKKKFDIEGMTCASCQLSIEKEVKKIGVDSVNVSLLTNSMEVSSDTVSDEEILSAVSKAGYKAISRNSKVDSKKQGKLKSPRKQFESELKGLKNRLLISIPLMILLMYVAMGQMIKLPYPNILKGYSGAGIYSFIQLIIAIPILYVNRSYFVNGFKSLANRHPNMDALVALGSSAAVLYGLFASFMIYNGLGFTDNAIVLKYRHDLYYEASTMILTLITLGKYLEIKSKVKTTDSINKLIDLQADTVNVIRNGEELEIALEDVVKNDLIKVRPGEKISVDGIVVEGTSSIDTSAVTGESMPVEIDVDVNVISGSVNNTGTFIMKATNVGENTTISKIIKLMEEASSTKASISKMADKIASIFVPIVIAISIISFVVWLVLGAEFTFAFSIAIGILVISCPCALGLATPVAMMVATGKAADNGILIKNAESLELLHNIDAIVFDKTGTITQGKATLTDIAIINNFDVKEALAIAYSLELDSEHPLALAIINHAKEKNIEKVKIKDFNSITGKGIEGIINNVKYYIGNDKLLNDMNIEVDEVINAANKYAEKGKTPVYLFNDNEIIAIFAIADRIKLSSVKAISNIKKYGIKTVMLTGDNSITAKAIADEVGIDEFKADLLPQDKVDAVKSLQENDKKVAMVGDGINDAPALMTADIGIGIADGTDIAIESADLVLMKSNLEDIYSSIILSRDTIKNVKQNLFWAFFYNILAIPVAAGLLYPAFGLKLNPMIGALAMSLSSVFVVTNSLRLKNVVINNKEKNKELDLINSVNYDKININEKNKKGDNVMEERILKIEGMTCGHCVKSITKELDKVAKKVDVSLENKCATVLVDSNVSDDQLIKAVEEAGYDVVSIK